MTALLGFAAAGLALGVLTSLPLGVANVAVIDAGLRQGRRRALGMAAGGALADTVHAGLALAGVGPFLEGRGQLTGALFVASGLAIAAYGIHAVRAARTLPSPGESRATARGDRAPGGFGVGLLLTGLNPAALLAWIVVAGAIAPSTPARGICLAAGVGAGAFAWFAVLAHLASRGRDLLGARGQKVSRIVGLVLVVLGMVSLARGVHQLLTP